MHGLVKIVRTASKKKRGGGGGGGGGRSKTCYLFAQPALCLSSINSCSCVVS